MANNVYANNEEVACKAGSGKSICAFPDVCMTPPENPATPPGVPVPYPNTGMDSDTTDGSRTVNVSGKEAMLKNKSYFRRSTGDEAGCAAKKGVVTSVNTGKVYFIAWSMDVKFEGENVVRNLDLTTHNHASPVANTPPQIFAARMAMANIPGCEGQREDIKKKCGENGENFKCPDNSKFKAAKDRRDAAKKAAGDAYKTDAAYLKENKAVDDEIDAMSKGIKDDPTGCQSAMRCLLVPYKAPTETVGKRKRKSAAVCCPGQTGHHLVEASSFFEEGREAGMVEKKNVLITTFIRSLQGTTLGTKSIGPGEINVSPMYGADKYDTDKAPCICVEGESQHQGTHGLMHAHQNQSCRDAPKVFNAMHPGTECRTLGNAQESGARAVVETFPEAGCDKGCIEAQLKKYHEQDCQMAPGLPIRAVEA